MSTLLIVILVLLLVGGIGASPTWGYHDYGWAPTGGLVGLLLVILLIFLLVGRV